MFFLLISANVKAKMNIKKETKAEARSIKLAAKKEASNISALDTQAILQSNAQILEAIKAIAQSQSTPSLMAQYHLLSTGSYNGFNGSSSPASSPAPSSTPSPSSAPSDSSKASSFIIAMDINSRRPIEGFIKGAPIYAKEVDNLELLPSPDTVQMVNDLRKALNLSPLHPNDLYPPNVSPSNSGKDTFPSKENKSSETCQGYDENLAENNIGGSKSNSKQSSLSRPQNTPISTEQISERSALRPFESNLDLNKIVTADLEAGKLCCCLCV
jgi:hypothetical protein